MDKKAAESRTRNKKNFAVLNESSLHKTLKTLYSIENNGKKEVSVENFVCDIITENNTVIEIQNKNVSSLKPKLDALIEKGYTVKVVHPVITEKFIETYSLDGMLVSRRKSPKKENLYSMTKELTGIVHLLKSPKFLLEIPEIHSIEKRTQTGKPVQSANKTRKWLKPYLKTEKSLKSFGKVHVFSGKKDYLALLPENLPECFSSKEIKENLPPEKKSWSKDVNVFLWVLFHAGFIERTEKKESRFYYRITK